MADATMDTLPPSLDTVVQNFIVFEKMLRRGIESDQLFEGYIPGLMKDLSSIMDDVDVLDSTNGTHAPLLSFLGSVKDIFCDADDSDMLPSRVSLEQAIAAHDKDQLLSGIGDNRLTPHNLDQHDYHPFPSPSSSSNSWNFGNSLRKRPNQDDDEDGEGDSDEECRDDLRRGKRQRSSVSLKIHHESDPEDMDYTGDVAMPGDSDDERQREESTHSSDYEGEVKERKGKRPNARNRRNSLSEQDRSNWDNQLSAFTSEDFDVYDSDTELRYKGKKHHEPDTKINVAAQPCKSCIESGYICNVFRKPNRKSVCHRCCRLKGGCSTSWTRRKPKPQGKTPSAQLLTDTKTQRAKRNADNAILERMIERNAEALKVYEARLVGVEHSTKSLTGEIAGLHSSISNVESDREAVKVFVEERVKDVLVVARNAETVAKSAKEEAKVARNEVRQVEEQVDIVEQGVNKITSCMSGMDDRVEQAVIRGLRSLKVFPPQPPVVPLNPAAILQMLSDAQKASSNPAVPNAVSPAVLSLDHGLKEQEMFDLFLKPQSEQEGRNKDAQDDERQRENKAKLLEVEKANQLREQEVQRQREDAEILKADKEREASQREARERKASQENERQRENETKLLREQEAQRQREEAERLEADKEREASQQKQEATLKAKLLAEKQRKQEAESEDAARKREQETKLLEQEKEKERETARQREEEETRLLGEQEAKLLEQEKEKEREAARQREEEKEKERETARQREEEKTRLLAEQEAILEQEQEKERKAARAREEEAKQMEAKEARKSSLDAVQEEDISEDEASNARSSLNSLIADGSDTDCGSSPQELYFRDSTMTPMSSSPRSRKTPSSPMMDLSNLSPTPPRRRITQASSRGPKPLGKG